MNSEMLCDVIRRVGADLGYNDHVISLVVNGLYRNHCMTTDGILLIDQATAVFMRGINVNGKTYELIQKIQEFIREKRLVMKVFLSHKMNGLTDEEVYKIRKKAKKYLTSRYGSIDIVDNFNHPNAPTDAGRLWHLAESIKLMEEVDGIYFCPGWMDAKGCQIEYEICKIYGLRILN